MEVEAATSAARCFEGEDIELTVTLVSPQILDEITFSLEPTGTVALVSGPAGQTTLCAATAPARRRHGCCGPAPGAAAAPGWSASGCRCGGVWQADLELGLAALEVFPHPPPARAWLVPAELRRRIGEHTARTPGEGVEFGGIRDYVPGDRLRDVNWAVSRRRGRLHTNQRAAERAADLVVMIDGFSDVGPPGEQHHRRVGPRRGRDRHRLPQGRGPGRRRRARRHAALAQPRR